MDNVDEESKSFYLASDAGGSQISDDIANKSYGTIKTLKTLKSKKPRKKKRPDN